MKLVKCIVREYMVDATTNALKELDLSGVTVTRIGGRGRALRPTQMYRCNEYEPSVLPQMMVDVVVRDDMADAVVRTVMEAARTGERGDGRIFVIPVEEAYSIRTRAGGLD